MSQANIPAFEHANQTAHLWINEILDRAGITDRHVALQGLRGVLHSLRDRLPLEQAVELAGQLPLLIRGIYYEGWNPHGKPLKERKKEAFLAHVQEAIVNPAIDVESLTRAVFGVLAKHVSPGEIKHVKISLPKEIQSLWAEEMHTLWF